MLAPLSESNSKEELEMIALEALEDQHRTLNPGYGAHKAISGDHTVPSNEGAEAKAIPYLVQKERKIRERIIAGDREGALQALDALLDSLRKAPGMTSIAFKSHLLQLVIIICRSAIRIGVDSVTVTEAIPRHAEMILKTSSYPTLRSLMQEIVIDLVDGAADRNRTPKSEIITKAKKYIAENYAKSPSLREVANYVHLSPHYFSRLFARENGCGFQDYLNRVRIEAAKDMLRNSPVKTKQAAFRVGFKDVSHFVRLFRRMEGMTPTTFARTVARART